MLSVIIPVYNCKNYIRNCVHSILSQTISDIEIVIIDDGSNDKSGEICDEIASIDERICVYHTVNKGSVSARCLGIKKSKGNLITFVDGDDWIETDMYGKMLCRYEQYSSDIISSGLIYDYDDKVEMEIDAINEGYYDSKEIYEVILPKMMYDNSIAGRAVNPSLCTKIFRRDLLIKAIENIDLSIHYGGDAAITYLCFAMANKIRIINDAWYHYCVRQDSLCHTYNMESFSKILSFKSYMQSAFKKLDMYDLICEQLDEYTKLYLSQAIRSIYDIDITQKHYLFPYEMIEKNSTIVLYGGGNVGKSYYKNIQCSNYVKVAAWVDINYENLDGLSSPNIIEMISYDYIIIAIDNEIIANLIKQNFIENDIPDEKIIWKKPIVL